MNVNNLLIDAMKGYFGKYPNIEKAVLFGSRARGDNTEKSDYDIAVYGALSAQDMANLRYIFDEELPTLHKIDLIFMTQPMNPEFVANIEKEGVNIYEKS